MTTSITLFSFDNNEVRTIIDENKEYWFPLPDVCRALKLSSTDNKTKKLREEDLGGLINLRLVDARGQLRDTYCVNEGLLFFLILRSKTPNAKKFRRFVTHKVLPALRKTGTFSLPQLPHECDELYYSVSDACHLLKVKLDKEERTSVGAMARVYMANDGKGFPKHKTYEAKGYPVKMYRMDALRKAIEFFLAPGTLTSSKYAKSEAANLLDSIMKS